MSTRVLYSYYRSSASYRVRIALNFKALEYDYQSVAELRRNEQIFTDKYRQLNPQLLIPILIDEGTVLAQSMAIIEYLEETYPARALLPSHPVERAYVRRLAQIIACDIHPLNNMRVLKYLTDPMQHTKDEKMQWYHHWLKQGFDAIEKILATSEFRGLYCFQDQPTMADMYLVPQVYNAMRFQFSLDNYPLIKQVNHNCLQLTSFNNAQPEFQPDKVEYSPIEEY